MQKEVKKDGEEEKCTGALCGKRPLVILRVLGIQEGLDGGVGA
jgi:hypothetical protein